MCWVSTRELEAGARRSQQGVFHRREAHLQVDDALGRTIQATANHKFLTIHGWKRLDELSSTTALLCRAPAQRD